MNEPIISPWIFYIMDVARTIIPFLVLAAAISIIAILIITSHINSLEEKFTSRFNSEKDRNYIKQEIEKGNKAISRLSFVLILSILFVIFIPSEEAIIRMVITKNLTPARIEKAGELTEKAIDKIIEKIINARFERGK